MSAPSRFFTFLLAAAAAAAAEPIVMNGAMASGLLGTPVGELRIVDGRGNVIPFQIDEISPAGEYCCPHGEAANAGDANGVLDARDEIVFLWDDATDGGPSQGDSAFVRVTVHKEAAQRSVWIGSNPALPLSPKRYIEYDHERHYLATPFFYARFGRDRFHFVKAGVMDFSTGKYLNLTNELRVAIVFKTLWGLLPFTYTEENLVCTVTRYKAGPLRLIRRGDFHLRLGPGIRGSRAVVYQFCYPQMVKVPVRVNLPLRFRTLFSEAFIEMTPILNREAGSFRFMVPSLDFSEQSRRQRIDTLLPVVPDRGYLVSDGARGYGWITRIDVDTALLRGSGYVLRRPTERQGIAECGFRLVVRDLPRGSYDIVNWVFFSKDRLSNQRHDLLSVLEPSTVTVTGKTLLNLLVAPSPSTIKR